MFTFGSVDFSQDADVVAEREAIMAEEYAREEAERWAFGVVVGDEVFNRTIEAVSKAAALEVLWQEFTQEGAYVCSSVNVTKNKGYKSVFSLGN